MRKLRSDFLWGGATAANQFEGAWNVDGKDHLLPICVQMERIRLRSVLRENWKREPYIRVMKR